MAVSQRRAAKLAWAVWGLTLALLVAWPFLAHAANTQESGPTGRGAVR